MPRSNPNQDQPNEIILEAINKNNENQKKILNSLMLLQHFLENRLSNIADSVDSKNETNSERTIAEIQTLQTDVKTLLAQMKKMENTPKTQNTQNSMLQPPTQTNMPFTQANINQMQIIRFKTWSEFQIFASKHEFSAYTYRDSDKLFEINAVKDNQLLVYIGDTPNVTAMLRSWLSNQLGVNQDKIVEGTIKP
jgi:hypothetical protein